MSELLNNLNDLGNKLSGLLNIYTICTMIFGLVAFLSKKFLLSKWNEFQNKKNKIQVLRNYANINKYVAKNISKDSIKFDFKKFNILILDDELDNYPINELKSIFFLDCKEKISMRDIEVLNKYHVIILDITGIVEEDIKKGGFLLLKELKKQGNRNQAIIASSSKRFDITVADFYTLADKKIKTPIEFMELKEVIEETIVKYFSIDKMSKTIDQIIVDNVKDIDMQNEIIYSLISYLQGNLDKKSLSEILMNNNSFSDVDKSYIIQCVEKIYNRSW